MAVWPDIERFIAEHGAAALVTLAESQGSSPREAGARMAVRPDGGFTGTIGGGALEWMALAEAQKLIASGEALRRIDQSLGPDLGQCCGGRVVLTIERFDAADAAQVAVLAEGERGGTLVTISGPGGGRPGRHIATAAEASQAQDTTYATLDDGRVIERFGIDLTPLYLFGAGHVGRSLTLALAPLPFAVTWIDPRPDAFPQHVPANVRCVTDPEPARLVTHAPDTAFIAIMTHSHPLDLDIAAAALKAERFAYVGLIGSDTKRARFVSSMRKAGLSQTAIDKLICPIGLTQIHDKAPAAIAASIVAQLLIQREKPGR
jgi:xanthine dehydrogenase accessory factor